MKYSIKVLLSTVTLLAAVNAPAEKAGREKLDNTQGIALSIINALPNSGIKNGLATYYNIISAESTTSDSHLGNNNEGIAGYLQTNFAENQCFAQAAIEFYGSLRKDLKFYQTGPGDKTRNRRASLGDISGITRPDLPAGWLFERAMKYADGDANKALALIGLCGHDDKMQGVFQNEKALEAVLAKGGEYEDYYDYDESVEEETPLLCLPQESDLYVAQSLSKDADISENLKKEILQVQYPGRNALQVASKNYHVLGAAFMTCQMIEAGMPKALAIQVEHTASSLYRGIRLCEDIKSPANLFNQLIKEKAISHRAKNTSFTNTVIEETMKRASQGECKTTTNAFCNLLRSASSRQEANQEDSFVRERLQTHLNQVIASALYSQWFAGGSILGIDLPCTHSQFFGPPEFIRDAVVKGNINTNICGHGLDATSCKSALKIIRTWTLDFDWTISQHRAGAIFAAKVCNAKKTASFKSFCKR